ncbi:transaldolase [Alkalilimnicola ehrlichii]|uniref:transaldolase n=1 Tax=Alkalilimnicola ehrlichii TaxID=351052 RepID=UPI003BA1CD86
MTRNNPLRELIELGQSPWFDNIHRRMLEQGELQRLVEEDGLRGVTSNPTIFQKAIGGSDAYDAAIADALAAAPELDAEGLFMHLALADIRAAADVLRPVWEQTDGADGFVSMEVSPELAWDTDRTIAQARELFARVDRPNVMIKVPATREGLPAIEALIADGISVNVTLLFSVQRYTEVVESWLEGLRRRREAGLPVNDVQSVASFFVSRVDNKADPILQAAGDAGARELLGSAAIANARAAYAHMQQWLGGPRWPELAAVGARPQRLLWASTGTKNPDYSDVLYVDRLVGRNTVTTLPPATWEAFRDHGAARPVLEDGDDGAATLAALARHGVEMDTITAELEREGVQAFVDSYRDLLGTLQRKAAQLGATPARGNAEGA